MKLTTAQQHAVDTDAREVLVISGAGSGKTRTMVERTVRMIRGGASPLDFLVLTFTRRASNEMRERLARRLGELGYDNPERTIGSMLCGTFHSIALRFLRLDGDKLGLNGPTLTVLDQKDADMVLEQVCRDLGYVNGRSWKHDLSWSKVTKYREAIYTGQADDYAASPYRQPLTRAFTEYRHRMVGLNSLDFGSLLQECRRLLTEYPDVLARYRDRIKHVVVDEVQDCDATQFDLHDFFAPPATFFAVGDFRQSIYGWRGARPDLCLKRHPNAELIQLRENFRSGARIVTAANSLIAHNGKYMAEPMVSATGRDGIVVDAFGRSADVARLLPKVRSVHGFAWRDVAVLARNHRALARLADACHEAGVPHYRVGAGFDICDTDDFRKLHAAMRLCVNHADNVAFLRLLETFNLTPTQYAEVRKTAADRAISHFEAMVQSKFGECTELETLVDIHGHVPTEAESQQAIEDVKTLVNTGVAEPLPLTPIGVIGTDLTALMAAVFPAPLPTELFDFWMKHCQGKSYAEALDWFVTRDAQDDAASGDVVTLSTIHAAKGLEWPLVLIVNCNDGELPSSMSMRNGDVDHEERNVAYVAITRARETLILHHRRPEDQDESRTIKPPSRFLAEAGVLQLEAVS